jgi:hypothetical protein
MNQELVKQLLEQLQQETKDPTDIGKLNIPNTMLWMKTNAYEPTTIKRVAKELKALRTELQYKQSQRSQAIHSKQNML